MGHLNLDALDSEGEPFPFEFGGEMYELPPQFDLRVGALFADEKPFEALELMLGPDQWRRLLAAPQTLTPNKLQALFAAWAEHSGITPGESSASTGSSGSTGRPSKPTSNGSTPRPSRGSVTVR
jgi:hypothetical protein